MQSMQKMWEQSRGGGEGGGRTGKDSKALAFVEDVVVTEGALVHGDLGAKFLGNGERRGRDTDVVAGCVEFGSTWENSQASPFMQKP